MIRLKKDLFSVLAPDLRDSDFLVRLDRTLAQLFDRAEYIPFQVRTFVDATSGAVTKYLPPGATNTDKDYFFVKTDASANAVTIAAAGTDTINGAATYVLAAQWDRVLLGWDSASTGWVILSP